MQRVRAALLGERLRRCEPLPPDAAPTVRGGDVELGEKRVATAELEVPAVGDDGVAGDGAGEREDEDAADAGAGDELTHARRERLAIERDGLDGVEVGHHRQDGGDVGVGGRACGEHAASYKAKSERA